MTDTNKRKIKTAAITSGIILIIAIAISAVIYMCTTNGRLIPKDDTAYSKLVEGDTYNVTQKETKYLYPLYWGSAPTVPSLADRGWEAVPHKIIKSTGQPVYSLEFGKEFAEGNTVCMNKFDSLAYSGLSPVSIQGITLSTIYGYPNYTYGVSDDAAYAATQMLIWEFQQVYRTGIKYGDPTFGIEGGTDNQDNFKARFYNGIKFKEYSDVMSAYEGIINAMSNHWLLPSFITTSDSTQLLFNVSTGYYEKTFVDANCVLPDFEVTSDSGKLTLVANGNELTVKSKSPIAKDITEKLTFNKKIGKNNTATLLSSQVNPDYQNLLCGTIADPVVGNFDVWTGIGKLNITKTAEDNMIKDVKFNVKSDVTGYNKDFVTDVNGKIQITNLDVGVEYIVSEIDSTEKYIIPSAKRIILNDTPMDISFNNLLARGNLTINKFDAVTKKPIEDTNFSVFSGTEKVEENFITLLSTKADGTASVLNLPCGVYTIFEVAPAIGYRKDNTPKTVTVKQDETTVIDWESYSE